MRCAPTKDPTQTEIENSRWHLDRSIKQQPPNIPMPCATYNNSVLYCSQHASTKWTLYSFGGIRMHSVVLPLRFVGGNLVGWVDGWCFIKCGCRSVHRQMDFCVWEREMWGRVCITLDERRTSNMWLWFIKCKIYDSMTLVWTRQLINIRCHNTVKWMSEEERERRVFCAGWTMDIEKSKCWIFLVSFDTKPHSVDGVCGRTVAPSIIYTAKITINSINGQSNRIATGNFSQFDNWIILCSGCVCMQWLSVMLDKLSTTNIHVWCR